MVEGTGGFLEPQTILKQLDIRDNMIVADFGCGHGYFSIPLAKAIPQGIVYALDVVEEALEAVQSQAKLEVISNIEIVHCNLEMRGDSKLNDQSIDLALLANILFQSQKKPEILKEAKRVLKKDGQLVLIDWLVGSPLTPKQGWFVSKDEAKQITETEGFRFVKELEMDKQHYGLVFKK